MDTFPINPDRKDVYRNLGWLLLDRGIRLPLGLLVGIFTARYLGVEGYGQIAYATTFVTLFGALALFGTNGIIVRDLVSKPKDEGTILGSAFLIRSLSSLLAFSGAYFTAKWIHPNDNTLHSLVAIMGLSLLFRNSDCLKLWFESKTKSRDIVLGELVSFVLVSCGYLGLVIFKADILLFAWAFSAQAALFAVSYLIAYKANKQKIFRWKVSTSYARILVSNSWPLFLSAIAVTLYMRIDQFMLGYLIGNEAVGFYAVAVQWSELWTLIPVLYIQSAFPYLTKEHDSGAVENFDKAYQMLTNRIVLLAVASVATTLVFAPILIPFCYGEAFGSSATIISIYVFSNLIVFNGALASKWIILKNRQKLLLVKTSIGALLNIGLNLWLIPTMGFQGAALATVISYSISGLALNLFLKDLRPLFLIYFRAYRELLTSPLKALT